MTQESFRSQVARGINKVAERFNAEPDNDASDLLVDIMYYVLTDDTAIRQLLRYQIGEGLKESLAVIFKSFTLLMLDESTNAA